MAKISKKEYRELKALDDGWKWIARDGSGELYIHGEKPKKIVVEWASERDYYLYLDNETFQFIQWEDEEPYSIAELIEEYEVEELRCSYFGPRFPKVNGFYNANLATWVGLNESEETEVKSKQELIEKWELAIEAAGFYGKSKEDRLVEYMLDFVDDLKQLDEPEVLSQEWIDDHAYAVAYDGMPDETEIVYVDELQSLLVPKQELPAIPKYNVKFKVKSSFGTVGIFLYKQGDEVLAGDNFKAYYPKEDEFRLTEQEIRDFQNGDVLFEHFAVKVEGLEENGKDQ